MSIQTVKVQRIGDFMELPAMVPESAEPLPDVSKILFNWGTTAGKDAGTVFVPLRTAKKEWNERAHDYMCSACCTNVPKGYVSYCLHCGAKFDVWR